MFGLIPWTMWSTWTEPDAQQRIALAARCLLLDDGSRKTLIETGYGDKWTPKERALYDLEERTVVDALREVGVAPEEISAVIVTHLHFDHAAGLTRLDARGDPVMVFPNARVHVQRREWEDAKANRSTMTRTYLSSHLDPIRDALELHDGAAEPIPGIVLRPLLGHTWGQQGVLIRDESDGITAFPADLLPTIHHVHASANMGYDMLPYDNMLSKRGFLEEAEGGGWRLMLDHEPNTPLVRAARDTRDSTRFRLVPL